MAERQIGTVTHYFGKPRVGIVALTGRVTIGDRLRFLGHGADFQQKVKSMQVDHAAVETASARTEVGIRVGQRVREGTEVCIRCQAGARAGSRDSKVFLLAKGSENLCAMNLWFTRHDDVPATYRSRVPL